MLLLWKVVHFSLLSLFILVESTLLCINFYIHFSFSRHFVLYYIRFVAEGRHKVFTISQFRWSSARKAGILQGAWADERYYY